MNTIEFEGKTIIVDGKGDEQFVNDKIQELREKRNNLQDTIFKLEKELQNRDYVNQFGGKLEISAFFI